MVDLGTELVKDLLHEFKVEDRGGYILVRLPYPVTHGASAFAYRVFREVGNSRSLRKLVGVALRKYLELLGYDTASHTAYVLVKPPKRRNGLWTLVLISHKDMDLEAVKEWALYTGLSLKDAVEERKNGLHIVALTLKGNVKAVSEFIKGLKDYWLGTNWEIGVVSEWYEHPELSHIASVVAKILGMNRKVLIDGDEIVTVGNDVLTWIDVVADINEVRKSKKTPTPVSLFLALYAKKRPHEFLAPFGVKFHYFRFPYFDNKEEYRRAVNEFAKMIDAVDEEAASRYFFNVSELLPKDAELLIELSSLSKASFKFINKGCACYNPRDHEVELRTVSKPFTVLHEYVHALDWLNEKERGKKLSDELVTPEVIREANKLFLKYGLLTDYEHHSEPHEILAELIEMYVIVPKEVESNPMLSKVVKEVIKRYPQLKEAVKKLRDASVLRVHFILTAVRKSEFMKHLEKLGIHHVPPEIKRILGKPVGKLTEDEKDVLLRWAVLAFGEKLLHDASRKAKHRARYVYTWLKNPSKKDLPGVDTPEVKAAVRKLVKGKLGKLRKIGVSSGF